MFKNKFSNEMSTSDMERVDIPWGFISQSSFLATVAEAIFVYRKGLIIPAGRKAAQNII